MSTKPLTTAAKKRLLRAMFEANLRSIPDDSEDVEFSISSKRDIVNVSDSVNHNDAIPSETRSHNTIANVPGDIITFELSVRYKSRNGQ